jgi:hypothetical protein
MPSGSPPANASPDSFNMTRFHLSGPGNREAADVAGSWFSCTAAASFLGGSMGWDLSQAYGWPTL